MKDATIDFLAFAGLGAFGYGCFLVSPPLAYISVGSIVFLLAALMGIKSK